MRKVILMALLTFASSSAMAAFTCEQIKDRKTRKSCIEDRAEKENAAEKKDNAGMRANNAFFSSPSEYSAEKKDNAGKEYPVNAESGKAVITQTCSLKGNGEASCIYKNSGNIKGSICHRLKLVVNPALALESEKLQKMVILLLSISGDTSEEICSGIVEAGDVRYNTTVVKFGGGTMDAIGHPEQRSPGELYGGRGRIWSDVVSLEQ